MRPGHGGLGTVGSSSRGGRSRSPDPGQSTSVLVVHSMYSSGPASGENRVAEEEARLLADHGLLADTWFPVGAPSGRVETVRRAGSALWSVHGRRKTRKLVGASGANVVHFHNLFPAVSPAALTAVPSNVAVVMTLHNYRLMCVAGVFFRDGNVCEECTHVGPKQAVRHRCYRGSLPGSAVLAGSLAAHRRIGSFSRVDRFIAVSEFVRDKHVAAGIPPETIDVVPNFAWSSSERRPPGDYFVYVGRLSPEKGVAFLVRNWDSSLGRLLVIGDGPDGHDLKRCRTPGVEFTGAVPGDVAAELTRGAKALLLPARSYEGSPRTVIEAFALGIPVIASRIGAVSEHVAHGETGFLAEVDDWSSWSECLRLINDEGVRDPMTLRIATEFDMRFSPRVHVMGLADTYTQARISRSRAVGPS
jgi:glycosyltransferase involved in cell wall biosynthesis